MNRNAPLEFRVLGPIEARAGDQEIPLGGVRQRTVLAVLLLRAEHIVPIERLIDDVWGEEPPPSAGHTLEAYVSRLRGTLTPHGVSLERRGAGYRLDLGDASLDSRTFERLLDESAEAAAVGEKTRSDELVREALALWRGAPLADIALTGEAAELARLGELHLQALERRIDGDLAAGRHPELVGELRALVGAHPYREHLVSQLMVALYRSGRQAEALDVYEQTRRALRDDLGLEPSRELQRLSGQIVRQEPQLTLPHVEPLPAKPESPMRRPRVRLGVLLSALAVGALIAGAVAWFDGAGSSPSTAASPRVALVVPRPPTAGREDTYVTPFVDGLLRAEREYDLTTRIFVSDELNPKPADLRRLIRELREEHFDLVLFAGSGLSMQAVLERSSTLPGIRLAFVDYFLDPSLVKDKPNVTAVRFAGGQAAYLAGYLSGLMERRQKTRNPRVSAVGGFEISSVTELTSGFTRGARRVLPGVHSQVDFSKDFVDQSVCERIANDQIDKGSHVVFAAAGTCGLGALSAAGIRGVWGVGADADRSSLGAHVLVSTVTRFDRAVELVVRWYVQGTLPGGKEITLGLDDDAVGITGISPQVPPEVRKKVAELAEELRKSEATSGP